MDNSIDNSKIKPIPSVLGGGCIIACACIGAGMLGLPSAGAGVWFIGSMFVLVITMLVMITSGCLLLEALQSYPYKSSFSTLTKDLLGKKVQVVTNLMVYFVGAILLYAYITSSGLIIQGYTSINAKFASVLFVLFYSNLVLHSGSRSRFNHSPNIYGFKFYFFHNWISYKPRCSRSFCS